MAEGDRPLPRAGVDGELCRECGAPLAGDQRYCLHCGTRRGTGAPIDFASLLAPRVRPAQREGARRHARIGPIPLIVPPQFAAAMLLFLVAAGILLGSLAGPAADSTLAFGGRIVNIALPGEPLQTVAAAPPLAAPTTPALPKVKPVHTTPAPAPAQETPAATPAPAAPQHEAAKPKPKAPSDVKHVFVVMLADQGYAHAFGPSSAAPYLARTLAAQGTVLSGYHAVAHGALSNAIALVSGQGPTPEQQAGCPQPSDVSPATPGADGQELGAGCSFSVQTPTVTSQILQQGLDWRAYVEGSAGCTSPPAAAAPPVPAPAWRDPFLFFHAVTDTPDCAEHVVGLDALDADLAKGADAPALSYIVPGPCHDGRDAPCAAGAPAGLAQADAFLRDLIPRLRKSGAYDDSLVVVTFDQAPEQGPTADASACCDPPAFPNTTDPGGPLLDGPGGGRTGALLLSPFVKRGKRIATPMDHFGMLRSIEDLLGLDALGYANRDGIPTLVTIGAVKKP